MTTNAMEPWQAQGGSVIDEPGVFPCSSSQERCWFINATSPGTSALNVALRWELKGSFSPATVERAFQAIVERHEILRTRFVEKDGVPFQEVAPALDIDLSEIDLTMVPQTRRLDEALRLGRLEAHKPFDLGEAPLLRITLVRLAADHAVLLVTVHQIVFDGFSIRLISHEFGTIAAAIEAGRPHGLPDLLLQYGDFASWQAAYLSSGEFEREKGYWRQRLAGAPYFEVSGDRARPPQPTYNGEILASFLPDTVTEAMTRTLKQRMMTLFSFGCAVMATALHHYTGAEDICIGTQIADRDDPDLDPLIGVFINNLVLRLDTSRDPTFLECLDRVNQTVQDALIHRRMPFQTLVELIKPPRDPRRMPLISVNFTVLQDVMDDARYGDFDLTGHPSLSAGSLYDLNFFMVHWPTTGWRIALEYNADLFDRTTGETILELWRAVFQLATDEPDFKLSALSLPGRRQGAPGGRDATTLIEAARPTHGGGVLPRADRLDGASHLPPMPRTPAGSADEAAMVASRDTATSPLPGSRRPASTFENTEAERVLLKIWKKVLGVESITVDSNFFEHGGHSLLALRMLSMVAATLGQKVGVSSLFASPTVREFANCVLVGSVKLENWNVVQIQSKGLRIPIIAINNTVIYYNVARRLGQDRPVVGIQLFDPEAPRDLEDRDLESIASDYVRIIRAAQPRGPYILMGLCVAGAIAYESAQQLREAGEEVPLVILADAWKPGFLARLAPVQGFLFRLAYRWHVARHHVHAMRFEGKTLLSVLASYPFVRRTGILALAKAIGGGGDPSLGREDWGNRWFLPQLEAARDRYGARPTKDALVILRSDEMITRFADDQMGWGSLAQGHLVFHRVPGWHTDMFQEPGASKIAAFLRPLLEQVDQAYTSPAPSR